jgi:hypothetical protein
MHVAVGVHFCEPYKGGDKYEWQLPPTCSAAAPDHE